MIPLVQTFDIAMIFMPLYISEA